MMSLGCGLWTARLLTRTPGALGSLKPEQTQRGLQDTEAGFGSLDRAQVHQSVTSCWHCVEYLSESTPYRMTSGDDPALDPIVEKHAVAVQLKLNGD